MTPYYADELVTLYLGDCREICEWLSADALVMDPPYGRNWKQGRTSGRINSDAHSGITGDLDTAIRDEVLRLWGGRPAIVFGDLTLAPPPGNKQTLVYRKPPNAGHHGALAGFRRDVEGIYLTGSWASVPGALASSVLTTGARSQGNPSSCQARYGHPHAKPVDLMETLVTACAAGIIADPSAGAGSTLIAARNLGRTAVGVEIEERYCERAAQRLCQGVLTA